MVVGGAAAEKLVSVDGTEVPYAYLHLPFGINSQGPYGLGLRVAFGLVKYQGLDVLLFLAVVGGIDETSGAFDDVPYGIVEGVGGVKVLVGKVQKLTIHSCFISGRSNRWPPAQGGYHVTKLQKTPGSAGGETLFGTSPAKLACFCRWCDFFRHITRTPRRQGSGGG